MSCESAGKAVTLAESFDNELSGTKAEKETAEWEVAAVDTNPPLAKAVAEPRGSSRPASARGRPPLYLAFNTGFICRRGFLSRAVLVGEAVAAALLSPPPLTAITLTSRASRA
ncbi:hypothetical protein V502_00150 [Pseudogymnoascus sp. VKM F-4520 (FW-2644)]|nr:hypothetical protein V502_00150 [Pseudogymnoascus sp. VKM F-4520 (FW-2644)]